MVEYSMTEFESVNDLSDKSNIQKGIYYERSSWNFTGIAESFDDHISHSVPLYRDVHKLITTLTDFFISESSTVIDIGSSTGHLVNDIAQRHSHLKDLEFFLIDDVDDMVEYSKKVINHSCKSHKFNFLKDSIINFDFPKNTSIITSIYTIQFVSPSVRQDIVNNIYDSLAWGGAFFFFEKTNANDARFHDILLQNYEDFKINNGFSLDEIKAKQLSLRGVLKPFSSFGNMELLKRSGFIDIQPIFRFGMFEGLLAIK